MENFTLTLPLDFDFNNLNLKYDPITNGLSVNIVFLAEILELSSIAPDREFTENQFNKILASLYQFHLSQNKTPIPLIEYKFLELGVPASFVSLNQLVV